MTWRFSSAGEAMLVGAAVFALLIAYVWRRRASSAGVGLALVLLANGVWGLTYALELNSGDLHSIQLWGDLKYLGIVLLPPAWLTFVLPFTGQARRLRGWMLALLAVEPLLVLLLLANDGTHDLIRYFPPGTDAASHPTPRVGPLFWVHMAYTSVVLWWGFGIFVVRLSRLYHTYRRQTAILLVSVAVPYITNVLFNLNVGPFGRIDLTPYLFVVTSGVLVWGVFRFNLLELKPVARGRIFETIHDAVLVLDTLGRVIDANAAAERLMGRPIEQVIGQPVARLLPEWAAHVQNPPGDERTLEADLAGRTYELVASALPNRRGETVGQLLVARDITDRKWAEEDLRTTLDRLRTVDDQRQRLLARLVDAQEGERLRIASSLSGRALQSVSTALVRLRALTGRLGEANRAALLDEVGQPLAVGVDELLGLLAELRQPVFDKSGLAAAIDEYAAPIRETGAEVEIKSHVTVELPERTRVNAFRIAQEALANVRAHALASLVTISVEESGEGLLVRVEDNGVGFDPASAADGPGITSMRRRVDAAAGWMRVDSAPGEGTIVECWLPV